jgi:hypothetical protein
VRGVCASAAATACLPFLVAFLAAPTANASVTVGQASNTGFNCGSFGYTLVQDAIAAPPAYTVPAGGGVLTSWSHAANADASTTLRLKTYRRTANPARFITVGQSLSSPVVTPNTLNTFPTRIRVRAADILGLSVLSGATPACVFTAAGGDAVRQASGDPAVGSVPTFGGQLGGSRVNVSAVLEQDADRDDFGDETQDKCLGTRGTFNGCPNKLTLDAVKQKGRKPKVKVTATVPGAGTLSAGSPSTPALAAAAAKVRLKPVTQILTSTSSQQIVLTLKLTKSAKRKLADKGKLKVQVQVVYTPPGGPPGSRSTKTKLKSAP